MGAAFPTYDVDLYADEILVDPYPHYRALRDLGAVVWLPRNNVWAVSRHADVRECLRNHAVFSSAYGVAANEPANHISTGNLLASDPPEHDRLRKLIAAPVQAAALLAVRGRIEEEAERLVERLVCRGSFDVMTDMAQHLPLTVVAELVGLPNEGRDRMLSWAAATFDVLGGMNARCAAARPVTREMRAYTADPALEDRLKPGSWAARLYDAAEEGVIPRSLCPTLMRDYLGPSLDTTIFATGHLLWLLGRNPEEWDALRADPALAAGAVNEAVRLESPIRGFTRFVQHEHQIGTVMLPAGARALILFASANRDERRWEEPERFDIRRKTLDQVGFGHGVHACVGMHLARLEMTVIITAFARRVVRFAVGEPTLAMNNVLRGFERLPLTILELSKPVR